MSSSSSSSSDNNNVNGNGGSDTIIAIVALVVSVIALVGTTLQVIQQYMASAAGYAKCDESVIGPWHVTKRRTLRLSEMRIRVLFETPVFFVCAAGNKNGPVPMEAIVFVDGQPESIKATRSLEPSFLNAQAQSTEARERGVHTADTDMSTWVRMLQELHRMERDSAKWQDRETERNGPHNTNGFQQHKLCVALQAKKRSWDTMPTSVNRPYATTTISHMVEMAAMLGIYWKEFNRSMGRYRAEGNGYVLNGTDVADLGIVFTFQICGKSEFGANRIIPVDEAKEFAFGLVGTIFRRKNDVRRLDSSKDGLLLLGSRNELAETLVAIGCNTNTSNCLRNQNMRHGHLFPLAFEIIGMLGQTLHLKESLYRFLPNPTFYHWDKKYFSMSKLIDEYHTEIQKLDNHENQVVCLVERAHAFFRRPSIQSDGGDARAEVDRKLMNELHDNLVQCDHYLKGCGRKNVELVLREHIQELLHMVNNEGVYAPGEPLARVDYGMSDGDYRDTGGAGHDGGRPGVTVQPDMAGRSSWASSADIRSPLPTFDDLMTAPPEKRQKKLMQIYFTRLLPRVAYRAEKAWENKTNDDDSNTAGADSTLKATSIWCTLVFRMLCWLRLHDFSKDDTQIPKSELLGSRLPAYIR